MELSTGLMEKELRQLATYTRFQIKNLGRTEEEIIAGLNEIVEQVVAKKEAKENLIREEFPWCWRQDIYALWVLKYARVLTSSDALTLLAQIKLGIDTNLIKLEKDCNIYELMVRTQPGNLQHYANEVFSSSQRDRYRAEYIRNNLPDLIK